MNADRRRAQLIRDVEISVLHEAWLAGQTMRWEQRARELDAARPRRSDFNGQATPADLAARWDHLTKAAAACRARAAMTWQSDAELVETLSDIGAPYDDLEQQLRHALDTGDRRQIARLCRLIDQADTEAAA